MPMGNSGSNGWIEYRKLVLKELEDLSRAVAEIRTEQTKIREAIAGLNVKSGVWGLVGGAIPVSIGIAVWLIKGSGQ